MITDSQGNPAGQEKATRYMTAEQSFYGFDQREEDGRDQLIAYLKQDLAATKLALEQSLERERLQWRALMRLNGAIGSCHEALCNLYSIAKETDSTGHDIGQDVLEEFESSCDIANDEITAVEAMLGVRKESE